MMSPERLKLQGVRTATLETARFRLTIITILLGVAFSLMALRTVSLAVFERVQEESGPQFGELNLLPSRADIVDRNGIVLATNLKSQSLYADPSEVLDPDDAAAKLVRALPDLNYEEVRSLLSSDRRFVWVKRRLDPRQYWRANALGLPGLRFLEEEERIYPQGSLASHVVGFVDIDGEGLAGLERSYQSRLTDPERLGQPLRLTIDARIQHVLTDRLQAAIDRHSAKGGAGVVLDVNTGELVALASLPSFDPNRSGEASADERFNRVTQGVYELGSTFKTFTIAAALEAGLVGFDDGYDAAEPIRVARFTIRDDHPKERWLSVPEIYAYSSNIGAAKLAVDLGAERQKQFLERLGMLDPVHFDIGEVGRPIFPHRWGEIATMTVSYGHGIAVSPLQLAMATAATVNGGILRRPTLLAGNEAATEGRTVLSQEVSRKMRELMRLVVLRGTGGRAAVPGLRVGGKTGTAEKAGAGGYQETALISSFVGVFPIDQPRYLIFAMIDEPEGVSETLNYATGGWVAAPVVGSVISRVASILGVAPRRTTDSFVHRAALLVPEDEP